MKVLVLGLSYKPDIDDDRESPGYELITLLENLGADDAYCDPYIREMKPTRKHDLGLRSVPCSASKFEQYDALVVSTAHREFKDAILYRGIPLVGDTRNAIPRHVKGRVGA
jgi:UDP-N-acetyl-D-glucosamine dehydrogenase